MLMISPTGRKNRGTSGDWLDIALRERLKQLIYESRRDVNPWSWTIEVTVCRTGSQRDANMMNMLTECRNGQTPVDI